MKTPIWKRKFVVWTALSVVSSLSAYVGSYASLVKPSEIRTTMRRLGEPALRAIRFEDSYSIPVPLPASVKPDQVQKLARRFFAPIHSLDRRVRTEKWTGPPMSAISEW